MSLRRWEARRRRAEAFDRKHGVYAYMRKAGAPLGVVAYAATDIQLVRFNVLGPNWRQMYDKWMGARKNCR